VRGSRTGLLCGQSALVVQSDKDSGERPYLYNL